MKRPWVVTGLLLALITGTTLWLSGGYTVFEKAIALLLLPAGVVWLSSTALLVVASRQPSRLLFRSAVLLWVAIYVAANPLVAAWLMRSLEAPYLSIDPLKQQPFDTIVVLGGGTNVAANGTAQLSAAGDRLMLSARMHRLGLTKTIVCTGKRIEALDPEGLDPAESARRILLDLGVPETDIRIIGGINTFKEMMQLAEQIDPDERSGLITSAWHLRRALRLADAHGMTFSPLPADFSTTPYRPMSVLDCIPDADAAKDFSQALREYLAMGFGR